MILSAHQSHYLPYLGYLDKIDRSDLFVVLDDVQYEKNGWQNRNRIRTAKGCQWLTVPVHVVYPERILDVQIDHHRSWQQDHWKSLELNYRKAPFFEAHAPFFQELFKKSWEFLVDLNETSLHYLVQNAGISGKKIVRSSSLSIQLERTERLVALCQHFGADTYLSGEGARAYLDPELFRRQGITLLFQDFSHPVYRQVTGKGEAFIEGLSFIDLLLNEGPKSLEILRRGRQKETTSRSG